MDRYQIGAGAGGLIALVFWRVLWRAAAFVWEAVAPDLINDFVKRHLKRTKHEKKGKHMSIAKKVKFIASDGFKPTNGPGAAGLRTAVPLTLKPGGTVQVRLGLVCDHALVVVSNKLLLSKSVFAPGEEIILAGSAIVLEEAAVEAGEVVAQAYPLGLGDFEIE